MSRTAAFAFAFAAIAVLLLNGSEGMRRTNARHHLTLWAWERPERLTFIRADTQVAFLAGTVNLNSEPVFRPRFQPLRVNDRTPLAAVVRLEITPFTPGHFSQSYEQAVVRQVLRAADLPRVRELQIDFDATRSQRDFYRALLQDIRQGWPADKFLSITALGSWCMGDDWIGGLPVDEAVPMLFRMGVDRASIVSSLQRGDDFAEPLCRSSIGISTDEPWPEPLLGRDLYVFNPRSWDPATVAEVERRLPQ